MEFESIGSLFQTQGTEIETATYFLENVSDASTNFYTTDNIYQCKKANHTAQTKCKHAAKCLF